MLPPPCMTVGKTQLSWCSSTGRHYTCQTLSEPNMFRLVWPQDMVPVIQALGLLFFSKLFAGLLVSQLRKRLSSGKKAIVVHLIECAAYDLSTERLTSCFFSLCRNAGSTHAPVFLKSTSGYDAKHDWGLNFFGLAWWGLFKVEPVLQNHCLTLAIML